VPDRLCDSAVWVREHAGEVVVVAGEGSGAHEVARHQRVGPGHSSITEGHYTHHRRPDPLARRPRARNDAERAFLALGEGAQRYLVEAAASGARRIEARMADAVTLASLHGRPRLDAALGLAAMAGRFSEGDLGSILVHGAAAAMVPLPPAEHSLSGGTHMWSALGGADEEDDQ
jgi:hypothetical protein